METVCGTHHYLAPELVRCDRGEISSYDRSVDVWGIGLIAFIMLFGFNPFLCESPLLDASFLHRSAYTKACSSVPPACNHTHSVCSRPPSCARLHPATLRLRLQARQQHADAPGDRRLSVHLS